MKEEKEMAKEEVEYFSESELYKLVIYRMKNGYRLVGCNRETGEIEERVIEDDEKNKSKSGKKLLMEVKKYFGI